MFDVLTIGDSTLDTFLILNENTDGITLDKGKKHLMLNYAEKIYIKNTDHSIGGNAANVAVGIKKLGLKSAIITELGDDIDGLYVKEKLSDAKVDIRYLKIIKNGSTRYSIVLNYMGERTILCSQVKRKYILPKIQKTGWIYYTSLGESFELLHKKLENYLKHNPNTKLAFNPGSYQLKEGLKHIIKLLPLINLLFVNKQEAEIISGQKSSLHDIFKKLHKMGIETVVITDGENGAWISDGQKKFYMPIYPVPPVGKTGAGDAFATGILAALIYKKNHEEALRWGTANSASVIQQIGAQKGLLNKNKLLQTIKKYSSIQPQIF